MFSTSKGLTVSQNPDGTYSWSGSYEGISVKSAIPIRESGSWIILLDPDASQRSAFENLLCIDQTGGLIWKAKLPTNPDVFVAATVNPDGIWATTWSGLKLQLDKNTGMEISRSFVK